MSGDAVVDLDVTGQDDLRTAKGRLTIACTGCRLGDDKTKLAVPANHRASAFVGDGIEVGHLDLGKVDIAIAVGEGKATIERFDVTSDDLTIQVTGGAKLAQRLGDAELDLCIRFGATAALKQRDMRTYALLVTTGAARGANDSSYLAMTGKVTEPRIMARVCDGSAPAPVRQAPQLPPEPPPPPVDLAGMVTPTSDTTFDVDAAKLAEVFRSPMSAARGARMVPAVKDGKPIGFKLYAIKQGSLFAQLRLNNGDVVRAIGGHPLAAADTALESYVEISKLAAGARVEVELERGGVRRTHVYTLR